MVKNSDNKVSSGAESVDEAVNKTAAMFDRKPSTNTEAKKTKK